MIWYGEVMLAPVVASAAAGLDLWARFGLTHPAWVHFPVALLLTAFLAEMLYVWRRWPGYGEAARVMLHVAAATAAFAAVAGFAAATGQTWSDELIEVFAIHRIAGIVVPVLALLAAGLGESSRRTGQIWELWLYRFILFLAAAAAAVSGWGGGLLAH